MNDKKSAHLLEDTRVKNLIKNGAQSVANLYIENDRPIFTEKTFEDIADFVKQNNLLKI